MEKKRCYWARQEGLHQLYHDESWGKPEYDEYRLFEMLNLEGQQSGLSWITILKKREGYQEAFHHFDFEKIAKMNAEDVERLMNNQSIVRHRLKIEAIIKNARALIKMHESGETLSDFLWGFVDGVPIVNDIKHHQEVPAQTDLSSTISKQLKCRGFSFVGPVTVYALMQAVGIVNDHENDCAYKQND